MYHAEFKKSPCAITNSRVSNCEPEREIAKKLKYKQIFNL